MDVLHVFTLPITRNGISMFAISRAEGLLARNIRLTFAAPGEPDAQMKAVLAAAQISYIPLHNDRKTSKIAYFFELARVVRRGRFSAVHAHGNSATLFVELAAARLGGARVRIAHSHNTTCNYKNADRRLRPLFYRAYTHAAACGTAAGEWLFPGRPFTVFPNGIDLEKFAFNPAARERTRADLGFAQNLVVGHVGRFNGQKNHAFLIDAFSRLQKTRPDARLLLVGDGYMEKEIRDRVDKCGLAPFVRFTGAVDNVWDYLCAMDIMALPSLYEGFPTVLIEWQCAGLPCLVSDRVTDEIALTDLIHFFSLEKSADDWARALLAMPQTGRAGASANAARLLEDAGYALSQNARTLADFYESAVREKQRRKTR